MFSKFKSFSSFRQTSTTALTLIFLCGFHLPALGMDDHPLDKEKGSLPAPAQQVDSRDATETTHQETRGVKRKREDEETNPGSAAKEQRIETQAPLVNPNQYLENFQQKFAEYRVVKASTRATPIQKKEAKRLKAALTSELAKKYDAGLFVTPDQIKAAFHGMAALAGEESKAQELVSAAPDYITSFPSECVTMILTNLPIKFCPVDKEWYHDLKDVRAFACVNTYVNGVFNGCIFSTPSFTAKQFPSARDFFILQNQFKNLTKLTVSNKHYRPNSYNPWDLSRISCLSNLTTLKLVGPRRPRQCSIGFVDFYDNSLNLQSNTKLTKLWLQDVGLANIGGLSELTGLTELSLVCRSHNKSLVHPIEKLDFFPNLTKLVLSGNTLEEGADFGAFGKLKKLKELAIWEDYEAKRLWSLYVLPHFSIHFPQLEHLILWKKEDPYNNSLTESDPQVQHLLSNSKIRVTWADCTWAD